MVICMASMVVVMVAVDSEEVKDGRATRGPMTRRFSSRITQWHTAQRESLYHDGWYRDNFRCNKTTFDKIVVLVEQSWSTVNEPIGDNAYFRLKDMVAITLHYLTHAGSIVVSASVFGASKTSAIRFIWMVIEVLITSLKSQFVKLPETFEGWIQVANGFEVIAGFPKVCGAVDGSLFTIERPRDYEGWYCRKGFPALNVQVVVDHRRRFMSFSVRPGSTNDKALFTRSIYGQTLHQLLPHGFHIVADAGYQLFKHVLTPYAVTLNHTPQERNYNYLHSKTRITVEGALGLLKCRFRIFKAPLNQDTTAKMSKVVQACMVLHNIIIDLQDDVAIVQEQEPELPDVAAYVDDGPEQVSGDAAKRHRDTYKNYLYEIR